VRFVVAGGTVSVLLLALRRWRLPREAFGLAAFYGVFYFGVPFGAVYWAEQYVASGLVSVLASTVPVILLCLDRLVLGNPAGSNQVLGVALSFAGVVVLFWGELSAGASLRDAFVMAAFLLSLLFMAVATLAVRSRLTALPILDLNASAMLVGGVALCLVSLLSESGPRGFYGQNLAALLYLAFVGSTVSIGIYMYLLKVWHVSRASANLFVSPAIALWVGAAFLGERLGLATYLGTATILLGVALTNARAGTRPAAARPGRAADRPRTGS
jgi:drug/metabolite transporter (DMT)-like permease